MENIDLTKHIKPNKDASKLLPIFEDKELFQELIKQIIELTQGIEYDKIACIEGKGFIVGSAVAFSEKKGIIPLRLQNKYKGDYIEHQFQNYSDKTQTMQLYKPSIQKTDRLLIIDDWVRTGETLLGAVSLIEKAGGRINGICVAFDRSSTEIRNKLEKHNYRYIYHLDN